MGGKTSAAVKNKWNAENYDRIAVMVPKGRKDELKEIAKKKGFASVNALIVAAIDKFITE